MNPFGENNRADCFVAIYCCSLKLSKQIRCELILKNPIDNNNKYVFKGMILLRIFKTYSIDGHDNSMLLKRRQDVKILKRQSHIKPTTEWLMSSIMYRNRRTVV